MYKKDNYVTVFSQSKIHVAIKALSQDELQHEKTNKMTCAPSKDSDQPGHSLSLIRVFAVRSMGS